MTSGGARIRSGPPADPAALRRDRKADQSTWTNIPAAGRPGPAPEWPMPNQTDREAQLWQQLWAKPQAILWEQNQQTYEVATHVRTCVEAEAIGASTLRRTLVRQQADALLLTMPAMQAARVRIVTDEVTEKRETAATTRTRSSGSARSRALKMVSGGEG